MPDLVPETVNSIRRAPCPGCGEQALTAPSSAESPCIVVCARCDREWEALADVIVVRDHWRLLGDCCSGFRRHELQWRQGPDAPEHTTRLQTWAQDRLLLRSGDLVSLLFDRGALAAPVTRRRRRDQPPMPLVVANHTLRGVWALVGAAPIATLGAPGSGRQ